MNAAVPKISGENIDADNKMADSMKLKAAKYLARPDSIQVGPQEEARQVSDYAFICTTPFSTRAAKCAME